MSAAVAPESPAIPTATGPDPAVMEAIERGNSVVFLDVALGDNAGAPLLGRIKFELFVQDVSELSGKGETNDCTCYVHSNSMSFLLKCPKTCENFRQVSAPWVSLL